MHSDCRNRALEAKLVGQWTCSTESETDDYTFLANNEFICVVTRHGESPFKIRGYWDILGNQLRIGTSPLTAEPAEIFSTGTDSFTAKKASGVSTTFQRAYQPGGSL